MRKGPNQSYEEWLKQVQDFELARALEELNQGVSPEEVLENLASRFFTKAIHPLYKEQEKLYQDFYKKK